MRLRLLLPLSFLLAGFLGWQPTDGAATAAPARDAVLRSATTDPPPGFSGGPYTTSTGETVTIYSADAYLAADPAFNQRWADFLASLVHGPELARVTVFLAPLEQVQSICGGTAAACYNGYREVIYAPGEDVAGRANAQSILAHEYGHHVARNRDNAPWSALKWGTKRWASALGVCRASAAGGLFPGDEEANYSLNPGEAFAEQYRLLNERRLGLPEAPWLVVDQSLYPQSSGLLDVLAEDVTTPWTADTVRSYAGAFRPGSGRGRTFHVATPYDGTMRVTLRAPRRSAYDLRIFDAAGSKVLTASPAGTRRVKTISYTVCGERSLQVRVRRTQGFGPFALAVARP